MATGTKFFVCKFDFSVEYLVQLGQLLNVVLTFQTSKKDKTKVN